MCRRRNSVNELARPLPTIKVGIVLKSDENSFWLLGIWGIIFPFDLVQSMFWVISLITMGFARPRTIPLINTPGVRNAMAHGIRSPLPEQWSKSHPKLLLRRFARAQYLPDASKFQNIFVAYKKRKKHECNFWKVQKHVSNSLQAKKLKKVHSIFAS